jgi:hypothetical protein
MLCACITFAVYYNFICLKKIKLFFWTVTVF